MQGLYGTSLRLCNAQPARENMGIELRVISLYATGLTRGLLYYFFVCPYHYLSNSYSLYLPIVLPASLTLCSHISPTICLSICLPCFLFLYSFFLLALSLPVCQFICLLYFFYSPAYTSLSFISPSCLLLLPHRILLLFVHLILCLYH